MTLDWSKDNAKVTKRIKTTKCNSRELEMKISNKEKNGKVFYDFQHK